MQKTVSPYSQIEKVVVNTGLGRFSSNPNFEKTLPEIINEMATLTGQKPSPRPSTQSISGFKVRAGAIIGLKTTLRKKRMADFLTRVIKIVLPRIRDFRGLNLKNVDQKGNLNIGIKEHSVFPEINLEQSKANFGLQITVVPKNIKNREGAIKLYRDLGIPLQKS